MTARWTSSLGCWGTERARESVLQAHLKRFDDGVARGEAAIASAVLLIMILMAAIQVVLHNVASLGFTWANIALEELNWIDSFLQKGTLWLAFLGASLATHADKHIAIDVVGRVLPGRMRLATKALIDLFSSVVAFFLARVFYASVLITGVERPIEYEVMTPDGNAMHVCDAAVELVNQAQLSAHPVFCAMRGALRSMGVVSELEGVPTPIETPDGLAQLIVPVMFLVIAVRLFVRFFATSGALLRGETDGDPGHAEKQRLRREAAAAAEREGKAKSS